ncbi:DmsC/YnfH family molybdoenzyme membrane anchor subunit, partial [Enterococcus casseliflavus]|uniref:DmsC/YnfH family molybdoenzyme membrane anchor subunit n=1 Tax=Enterococcus casseliflavus TaxID=37734 RepID=UPI003D0D113E
YGLLAWLGACALHGRLPFDRVASLLVFGFALVLVTVGLLASLAHLGQPQRAWRAFSQWRSSWLAREGVLSMITYAPA